MRVYPSAATLASTSRRLFRSFSRLRWISSLMPISCSSTRSRASAETSFLLRLLRSMMVLVSFSMKSASSRLTILMISTIFSFLSSMSASSGCFFCGGSFASPCCFESRLKMFGAEALMRAGSSLRFFFRWMFGIGETVRFAKFAWLPEAEPFRVLRSADILRKGFAKKAWSQLFSPLGSRLWPKRCFQCLERA